MRQGSWEPISLKSLNRTYLLFSAHFGSRVHAWFGFYARTGSIMTLSSLWLSHWGKGSALVGHTRRKSKPKAGNNDPWCHDHGLRVFQYQPTGIAGKKWGRVHLRTRVKKNGSHFFCISIEHMEGVYVCVLSSCDLFFWVIFPLLPSTWAREGEEPNSWAERSMYYSVRMPLERSRCLDAWMPDKG